MIIVDGLVWVSEWLVCSRCGEVFTMNARVAAMESIQLMGCMCEPLGAGVRVWLSDQVCVVEGGSVCMGHATRLPLPISTLTNVSFHFSNKQVIAFTEIMSRS